ncbi:MAG: DUF983 domain-containing protein [Ilumatobacteraceae bacterium]
MVRPSLRRMLWRGLRRACPWCGGRHAFFVGWFDKTDHCRSCGLRWRRDDVGFELGAATMAAILTLGPLILALAAILAITWPTVPAVPMLAALVPVAIVLPIILYPVSYTTWQALDIAMRPVTVDDFQLVELLDDPEDGALDDPPGGSGRP